MVNQWHLHYKNGLPPLSHWIRLWLWPARVHDFPTRHVRLPEGCLWPVMLETRRADYWDCPGSWLTRFVRHIKQKLFRKKGAAMYGWTSGVFGSLGGFHICLLVVNHPQAMVVFSIPKKAVCFLTDLLFIPAALQHAISCVRWNKLIRLVRLWLCLTLFGYNSTTSTTTILKWSKASHTHIPVLLMIITDPEPSRTGTAGSQRRRHSQDHPYNLDSALGLTIQYALTHICSNALIYDICIKYSLVCLHYRMCTRIWMRKW